MTQRKRGYSYNRVFITSLKQKMPHGKSFDAFLSNSENKIEMIEMIVRRFSSESVMNTLQFELVVTQGRTL